MRFVQAGVMLIGAVAYVVVAGSYEALRPEDYQLAILLTIVGWNALLLVVSVLVAVDAVLKVRAGRTKALATGVLVVKIAAIPFFLINFAVMGTFGALGTVVFAFAGLAAVAVVVTLTWLAMLTTSIYGWATIVRLRRDGRIGTPEAVVQAILSIVFVADVVGAVLLLVRSRRARPVAQPALTG